MATGHFDRINVTFCHLATRVPTKRRNFYHKSGIAFGSSSAPVIDDSARSPSFARREILANQQEALLVVRNFDWPRRCFLLAIGQLFVERSASAL